MASTRSSGGRTLRNLAIVALLLAGVWRAVQAAALPCISRDGVTFCWFARHLGERGLPLLREGVYEQHPLFPLLILGVQRGLRACGATDSPLTWQSAGQVVGCLAGMTVVALSGALTLRFVRRLALPLNAELAAGLAMLLAALLPLNVELSADVMSDELHLAFYLAGACVLLRLESWRAGLACGVFAGLAFLTRPEGAAVALAGVVAAAAPAARVGAEASAPRGRQRLRAAGRGAAVACGFALAAAPLFFATGKVFIKKDLFEAIRGEFRSRQDVPVSRMPHGEAAGMRGRAGVARAAAPHRDAVSPERAETCGRAEAASEFAIRDSHFANRTPPLQARLTRRDVPWFALLPMALYELFRAGRVVVPLLAIAPLIHLRRRLLRPPLLGWTTCIAAHVSLTLLLLHRWDYLHPRHQLVLVALLIPPAAALLARLVELAARRGRKGLSIAVVAAALLPLAAYSLRQPNSADRFLVDAARALAEKDPAIGEKLLMGGASQRRIAFYADSHWASWYEDTPESAKFLRLIERVRPDYFAIEEGGGDERAGNAELIRALRADPALASRMSPIYEFRGESRSGPFVLHVFAFRKNATGRTLPRP